MRVRTILIPTLFLAAVLSACNTQEDAAPDGAITVVASFYPLAFAAERIGGSCVDVDNLTPAGVEPHDLELTPEALEEIATADVVLYLGGGFQPAIEEAVGSAEGTAVDLLEVVPTTPAEGEEAEEGLAVDPHIWLDPGRFELVVPPIARALDRAGAPCDLADSAASLRSDLAELDRAFENGLRSCRQDLLVTNHAAFGYLAGAYGLRQEAISGLEPEAEPTPKRLAELRELVERERVTTIFTEELVAPDVAETLATEAGVRTEVLLTIEGLTDEEAAAGEDYRSLMHRNLEVLRVALDCV